MYLLIACKRRREREVRSLMDDMGERKKGLCDFEVLSVWVERWNIVSAGWMRASRGFLMLCACDERESFN